MLCYFMDISLSWFQEGKMCSVHIEHSSGGDVCRFGRTDFNKCYEDARKRAIKTHIGDPDTRDPDTKLSFYITYHP